MEQDLSGWPSLWSRRTSPPWHPAHQYLNHDRCRSDDEDLLSRTGLVDVYDYRRSGRGIRLPCAGHRVMPAPLTAQQSALPLSKRRAGNRQIRTGRPAMAQRRS
jgi:hypothetical protein